MKNKMIRRIPMLFMLFLSACNGSGSHSSVQSHTSETTLTSISLEKNSLHLAIGDSDTITLTNTGNSPLLNLKISPSSKLTGLTESDDCNSLAPEGHCTLTFSAAPNTPAGTDQLSISADNVSGALTLPVEVGYAQLHLQNSIITTPQTHALLEIVNTSQMRAKITAISVDTRQSSGIVIHQLSPCQNVILPPEGHCSLPYDASLNAYGSVLIHLSANVMNGSMLGSLSIPPANVVLTPSQPALLNVGGSKQVRIFNPSPFNLQNITFILAPHPTDVTVDRGTCGPQLAANSGCTLTLHANGSADPNQSFNLHITASGGTEATLPVALNGVTAFVNPLISTLNHVAIMIQNREPSGVATALEFHLNDHSAGSTVNLTANTDPNFPTTCAQNQSLNPGESCTVWLTAREDKNVGIRDEGSLSITLQTDNGPYTANFSLQNQTVVFAGGFFIASGNLPLGGVAAWNGQHWDSLNDTIISYGDAASHAQVGDVRALIMDQKGYLYVGGLFQHANQLAVSNIVKWNGHTWSTVGAGLNNIVYSLAVDPADHLYAGGAFTASNTSPLHYVAQWDGHTWSDHGGTLNDFVKHLDVDRTGRLYASGYFFFDEHENFERGGYIAYWENGAWHPLDKGLAGAVDAFGIDQNNRIYALGDLATYQYTRLFKNTAELYGLKRWENGSWQTLMCNPTEAYAYVFGPNNVLYIANHQTLVQWDGQHCTPMTLSGGVPLALTADQDHVYVGGSNIMAQTDGISFEAMGDGIYGDVQALTLGNMLKINPIED